MQNTMPHDKRVEVLEVVAGLYRAYLHDHHAPISIDAEDGQRTEYRCETVVTEPMSFASEQEALEFFTEHHGELFSLLTAREAMVKAKADAEVAQAYLQNTDYMVVKCAERGLSMLEEYPVEYAKREEARLVIREYRGML